ncbi:hypothetical protein ABZZ36_37255 [Actinacidiphila glaucinigra]|uniref:hypothetical protein n=1 Tax=Actinacidiphila glaucinigra TaxID=235986 RepID=UPI0033A602C3
MTDYVVAATEADGNRLGERVTSAAPTLAEASRFGDSHGTNYVSVRHGHDITLYAREVSGTWSVLVADAPAPVVVEIRRQHALHRPGQRRGQDPERRPGQYPGQKPQQNGDGDLPLFEYDPAPENEYELSAIGVDGEVFGDRLCSVAPTPAEVAELGDLHEANYVMAGRPGHDMVTLYGRDARGSWSVIAADVDVDTAEEVCLWFDLTQHYQGRSPAGRHPLDEVLPAAGDGPAAAAQAVSLVVEHIRARRLDYPTEGLTADRFTGGWSVYAPVEVAESDPMAFLDIPVGRSVFLVGDTGRVKEVSSSVPPRQAEEMFAAEETYVRRQTAEERYVASLWEGAARLVSDPEGSPGISSFTVASPSEEEIAAVASRLIGPIAQQLALLGPPGWDRFTAVFSFTVSAEVAQLRFRSGKRTTEVRVPEQLAMLVRRQRHLAARMPAGPWWRLLLTVAHTAGTGARMTTDYDYGDEPFPAEDLLNPEHYRNDLVAYPRPQIPAWLSAYVTGSGGPGHTASTSTEAPRVAPRAPRQDQAVQGVPRPTSAAPTAASVPDGWNGSRTSAPPSAAELPARPGSGQRPVLAPGASGPVPEPVLDAKVDWKTLHADPHVITHGRTSIELKQAEWVSYSVTQTATKRLLFPTSYFTVWEFMVGRYPYYGGPRVTVRLSRIGRRADEPAEWTFLVNLVRRYLEPRLLGELVDRVRRGETVTLAGSVQVSRAGIACKKPKVSLPWNSIRTQIQNGVITIWRPGVQKPVLTVPLSHPNASLIPALFAAFTT